MDVPAACILEGMLVSHTLVDGTNAVIAHTSQHHRLTAKSSAVRVVACVDALIDQAHRERATASGVLHLAAPRQRTGPSVA